MELINDGRPFTARQAARLGWSAVQTSRAVDDGRLRRVIRGVFVDAWVPDSRELRFAAVRLVAPAHAVACNETAARLHGIDAYAPGERHLLEPSFLVPHAQSRMRRPGIRCRQAIVAADDVEHVGGVWVTTPLRTSLDLLRTLYRPYALASADAFVARGLVDRHELVREAHRLTGYRGIVQARELATFVDGAAASPGESWMRLRLLDAGLPRPTLQHEVVGDDGRSRFLDLAYPESLVGAEYDGRRHHTSDADVVHDLKRRSELERVHGWRIVVARREDVFGPDPSLEIDVAALLGETARLPRLWGTAEQRDDAA